jgi:hypothetical protein
MSAVSSADHSSFGSDFARAISRRFEHGRFLIGGANAQKLQCQFAEAKREAAAWSHNELASKLSRDTDKAQFETAIWFYSSRENEDEITAKALSISADAVILMPLADVDLCLKIRRAGCLIVYTPCARLYWHDAPGKIDMAGRGDNGATRGWRSAWRSLLQSKSFSRARGFLARQVTP